MIEGLEGLAVAGVLHKIGTTRNSNTRTFRVAPCAERSTRTPNNSAMGALEVDQLSSLKLTNVYYDPNSVISLISAFLALVPQALLVVYITLIFAQRELEVVVMFSGQILCEALNWGLKRTFKQQRPERNGVVAGERTDDLEMHGKGYGMPSSHAQFVAFFATYLGLWLLLRVHYFSLSRRIRDTFLVAVMSVLVCISR